MHLKKALFILSLIGCLLFPSFSFAAEVFYYTVDTNMVTIRGYSGTGGEVFIPKTIGGMPVVTIGDQAFAGNISIISITIPDTVTGIEDMAFEACTGLTSAAIPKSVTSIGDGAFSGCASLTAAYFYGDAPIMGTGVFAGSATTFTVYYTLRAKGFTRPFWLGYPSKIACIATKVLGAGNSRLEQLRYFRDNTLAQSVVGRKIISMYYNNSDSINAALERSPALRAVMRKALEVIAVMVGNK